LFDRLGKLNKKARKLGCPEVAAEELARETRTEHRDDEGHAELGRCPGGWCAVERVWVRYRIEGDAPKLAGYSFVATLAHTVGAAGVFLATVPGETVPPEFRDVEPGRCDHCKAHRRRTETFVVRHDETGEHKVVGRNCVADFLGGRDPKAIASYLTWVKKLLASLDGEELGGCSGSYVPDAFNPATVLAYAVYFIALDGWVSRAVAREYHSKVATADTVWGCLTPFSDREKAEARKVRKDVSDADHEKARKVLWWVATEFLDKPDRSDYEHNLVVSLSGSITRRTVGVAASAVIAYDRAMGLLAEKKARAASPSKHLYEPKVRFETEATVVFDKVLESDWGTTHLIKFRDDYGNMITWFASGTKEVEIGKRFKVRATVKKHETFRGEASTVVTRAVLTELKGAA
jgi:hypothetical protein